MEEAYSSAGKSYSITEDVFEELRQTHGTVLADPSPSLGAAVYG